MQRGDQRSRRGIGEESETEGCIGRMPFARNICCLCVWPCFAPLPLFAAAFYAHFGFQPGWNNRTLGKVYKKLRRTKNERETVIGLLKSAPRSPFARRLPSPSSFPPRFMIGYRNSWIGTRCSRSRWLPCTSGGRSRDLSSWLGSVRQFRRNSTIVGS